MKRLWAWIWGVLTAPAIEDLDTDRMEETIRMNRHVSCGCKGVHR